VGVSDASAVYRDALVRESKRIADTLAEANEYLSHNPSKGLSQEESVAHLIRRFLPDRFVVTSGFAVNDEGRISPQQDVLVVLNDRIGPIATYMGFGVYPIENVFASIEVKTTLTVKELVSGLDSLAALRSLSPERRGESGLAASAPGNLLKENTSVCGPLAAVIAITSRVSNGRTLHECRVHPANGFVKTRVNSVYVHNRCHVTWVVRLDQRKHPTLRVKPQEYDFVLPALAPAGEPELAGSAAGLTDLQHFWGSSCLS